MLFKEDREKKVLDKIEEIKREIDQKKLPMEAIDYFFIGFAVGSNYEASFNDNTNYESLLFWGKLKKDVWPKIKEGKDEKNN